MYLMITGRGRSRIMLKNVPRTLAHAMDFTQKRT